MHISKGDIVLSLAGRDRGRLFYVLDTDGQYALLANGKLRPMENPKRKKLRHLRFAARTDSTVAGRIASGDKVLNSELRRDLAIFGQTFNSQNQGG